MTPPAEAASEPSIEEILDSIRQIISDDEGEAEAPASPGQSDESVTQTKPDDDIIELTEKVEEAKPPPPPPPMEPEPVPNIEMQEPEPAPPPAPVQAKQPEPPPVMTPPPPPSPAPPADAGIDSLLTRSAEDAAMRAFSELSHRAAIEKGGGITIEDVVRYEVRPLLRAWIDKHLPGIVERLVQKELEKISARFDQD